LISDSQSSLQNIFEKTFREYRRRLTSIDMASVALVLGLEPAGAALKVPFLGHDYRVGTSGVSGPAGDRPDFATCVVLLQLLLRCPARRPDGGEEWTAYRDFANAAPLTGFFRDRIEGGVIRAFSGRVPALQTASVELAGRHQAGFSHDLARRFEVLPQVSLLLLFNEAAEELPAACSLLFQQRAASFLDMECLAIAAELFVDRLLRP
jgi:hypothetical protein